MTTPDENTPGPGRAAIAGEIAVAVVLVVSVVAAALHEPAQPAGSPLPLIVVVAAFAALFATDRAPGWRAPAFSVLVAASPCTTNLWELTAPVLDRSIRPAFILFPLTGAVCLAVAREPLRIPRWSTALWLVALGVVVWVGMTTVLLSTFELVDPAPNVTSACQILSLLMLIAGLARLAGSRARGLRLSIATLLSLLATAVLDG